MPMFGLIASFVQILGRGGVVLPPTPNPLTSIEKPNHIRVKRKCWLTTEGGNSYWKVDTDVPRKLFGHKQGDQYIIENGDPNTRQLITS